MWGSDEGSLGGCRGFPRDGNKAIKGNLEELQILQFWSSLDVEAKVETELRPTLKH